jgi:hypothetical protein
MTNKKSEADIGYHPRRCGRCWYYDKEDGTCHGIDPVVALDGPPSPHVGGILVWGAVEADSFCRHYFPRCHAEKVPQSQALPQEEIDRTKKKKPKKKKAR